MARRRAALFSGCFEGERVKASRRWRNLEKRLNQSALRFLNYVVGRVQLAHPMAQFVHQARTLHAAFDNQQQLFLIPRFFEVLE